MTIADAAVPPTWPLIVCSPRNVFSSGDAWVVADADEYLTVTSQGGKVAALAEFDTEAGADEFVRTALAECPPDGAGRAAYKERLRLYLAEWEMQAERLGYLDDEDGDI
jgi:hypothetical protein